jgi:hypothetical protein
MRKYVLTLLILACKAQAGFHDHAHGDTAENRYSIGMEDSSLEYLKSGPKQKSKMPKRPFTMYELMGDPDMNQDDLLVVPFAEGAKMVPAGQILSVINQVEAASNRSGQTLRKCDKKSLLMVFIKNRHRDGGGWFPACSGELP